MNKNLLKFSKEKELGFGNNIRTDVRTVDTYYPIHTHDYFELEFILSGKGVHYINTTSYPLKRGSVMFLTPADCHCMSFSESARIRNISFDKSIVSEAFLKRAYAAKKYKYYFEEVEFSKLEIGAEILQREIETTGCVQPLLEYFLSLILPETAEENFDPLNSVIDYINMNFRESPSLNDMSRLVYLSPVYFGHLFKKKYGISFNNYVNGKKVELAKQLLANGMNVTDTCFESGFNSLSNFLKVFKAETGENPKEYQKHQKKLIIPEQRGN